MLVAYDKCLLKYSIIHTVLNSINAGTEPRKKSLLITQHKILHIHMTTLLDL